jgi:hypothetical protein
MRTLSSFLAQKLMYFFLRSGLYKCAHTVTQPLGDQWQKVRPQQVDTKSISRRHLVTANHGFQKVCVRAHSRSFVCSWTMFLAAVIVL